MKLLAVFCLASLASDAVALHVQPRQAGDGCATAAAAGKGGRVSPSVATSCLKAVQLKKPNTVKLITQLKQYLQWHSLTDVLVNPGADYTQNIGPAVDLQAGLDAIASQVNTGTLTSEYEVIPGFYPPNAYLTVRLTVT